MTRTDLRVLFDSRRFSFVSTNGMEPTFFDDNVVWKLQVRNFLPIFGSVILFGTVWNTTILRHLQKLAPFTSGGHFYLPGPTSLVFKLIAPSLFSFCIGCIGKSSLKWNSLCGVWRHNLRHSDPIWREIRQNEVFATPSTRCSPQEKIISVASSSLSTGLKEPHSGNNLFHICLF